MAQILVVEDEEHIRETIVDILELADHEIATASDGRQALDVLKTFHPDLIISDVNMPEMDGFELLNTLRSNNETRNIPWIFLTAKAERHDFRYGMSIGADDYVTKPFTAEELLTAVNSRLARFQQLRSDVDRHLANFTLLQQMDQELSERLEPNWLINMIFDWVLRQSNANEAFMFLKESADSDLTVRYIYGSSKKISLEVGQKWHPEGVLGEVLSSGSIVLEHNVPKLPNLIPITSDTKSLLAVPIIFADVPMGLIVLESEQNNGFNHEMSMLLLQMANRASIALQHAQLFDELRKQREIEHNLRLLFRKFVSEEVATALEDDSIPTDGIYTKVAILFCDIRNFTSYSETHSASEVVAMLNTYIPVVVEAARKHGGNVNKFGGDSVMIVFGAPNKMDDPARRAILTALQITQAIPRVNEQLFKEDDFELVVGIGINTGNVIAGTVGAEERQEYTVIGDTVNLAARIESLNKQYPDYSIFITDDTYQDLGEQQDAFVTVELGNINIRGKADPVKVWAVQDYDNTHNQMNELT